MEAKLVKLRDGKTLVSAEDRKKVEDSFVSRLSHWRKRKRMFTELWNQVSIRSIWTHLVGRSSMLLCIADSHRIHICLQYSGTNERPWPAAPRRSERTSWARKRIRGGSVHLENRDLLDAQTDVRGLSLGLASNVDMKHGSLRMENHCFLIAREVVRVPVRKS
jgi:hypothetical protein